MTKNGHFLHDEAAHVWEVGDVARTWGDEFGEVIAIEPGEQGPRLRVELCNGLGFTSGPARLFEFYETCPECLAAAVEQVEEEQAAGLLPVEGEEPASPWYEGEPVEPLGEPRRVWA